MMLITIYNVKTSYFESVLYQQRYQMLLENLKINYEFYIFMYYVYILNNLDVIFYRIWVVSFQLI